MALKSREWQQLWYQKSQRPEHQLHQGEERPERLKDKRAHFPSNVRGRGVVLLIASRTTAHASLIITNKFAFEGREEQLLLTTIINCVKAGDVQLRSGAEGQGKIAPGLWLYLTQAWPVCLIIFKKWVQILTTINFFPDNKKVSDWYDNYCAKW